MFGFQSAIKKFGLDRWKRNCVAATDGFQHVLDDTYGSSGGSAGVVRDVKNVAKIKISIAKQTEEA